MDIDVNRVRAVVFDLDGTLYDNRSFPFWLIVSKLRDMFVFGAERNVRKQMKGVDLDNSDTFYASFFSHLADHSRFSEAEAKEWYWNSYMELFPHILSKHCRPYDGVEDVFNILSGMDIPTAIYSDYPLVVERVEALGLPADMCENYWSAPEMGAFKPAIRPMHEIASAMGVDSHDLLVVGDRVDTDGKSAFACGAQFIHILKKKKATEDNPDYVSMHWSDFADFVRNWNLSMLG